MALGIRLLSSGLLRPSLLLWPTLLKRSFTVGGACLASQVLLCGLVLMPSPVKAFPLLQTDEPHGKQSVMPEADDELPADSGRPTASDATDMGWSVFTSDAGKFRIAMPSAPAAYTFLPNADLVDAEVFSSRMYMQMQLVDANHLEIYAAAFVASTRFTEDSGDANEALLGCVTGLSNRDPVRPPEAIALGDYSGIEAEFLTEEGSLQVSRCYLAGDRAYLLTATNELFSAGAGLQPVTWGSSVPVRSPAMDMFFNSFEILP